MAVAHDALSESHTGTTGSASEASFSWTHTPTGTPAGALVFVITNADADDITSVTYGGTTMTQVSEAIDSAGEPGRCTAFHLGASIPTGAQTVVVNRVNNADVMWAAAMTQTAGADTEVYTPGIVLIQGDNTLAEQSVDDGSTGVNSLRYAGLMSGLASVPAVGANSTSQSPGAAIDFGTRVAATCRETTAGQGSRSVGFSSGTTDDVAAVHLAVREVVAAAEFAQFHHPDRSIYPGPTNA